MHILILGGTAFLSREIAREALSRRHTVTCAARGVSGQAPEGVTFIRWERDDPAPPELADLEADAVVDLSTRPVHVQDALETFAGAHWVYVSSVSVYSDHSRPGGTVADSPVHEPLYDDVEPDSAQIYGGLKAACEELVQVQAAGATVVRPGLIAGPGDPSGRFAYWPASVHAATTDGLPVLVPEPAEAPVQLIDVRDLASWIVHLAAERTAGVFDAVRPSQSWASFVAEIAAGLGVQAQIGWVPVAHLETYGVQPWSGRRSVPLWLPGPEWAGFLDRDVSASLAAGLRLRPLAETARDTWGWASAEGGAVAGLTRAEQVEILAELTS